MLATLIPLFDGTMNVRAYSLFTQKDNFLLNPSHLGTGILDGLSRVNGLDLIKTMGLETLSDEKEVFVEVNNVSIFSDIENQCSENSDKLVLLADASIIPEESYVNRLSALKNAGFKFAMRKLPVNKFEEYRPILSQTDYILLDHKKIDISKAKIYFHNVYPNIKLCAVNVDSQEDYDRLVVDGGYDLYEGEFFRMPAIKNEKDIAPVKINYIELLNIVNDTDFDLTKAADIIGRDTALVISLLKMVNHIAINSEITSIRHAAAMLGQKELKKWINTAVTNELCSDRPSEITRLSLIRAKFAENLASVFDIGGLSSELFLTGLFSVIDIILEKPMEEALTIIKVSKAISNALLERTGELGEVLNFIIQYENASWQEVSRLLLLKNVSTEQVYKAYSDTLEWYKKLFES